MTSVSLQSVFKRYPRSMTGWSAFRRLWELFQPPHQLSEVTDSHLADPEYLWAVRGVDLSVEPGEVVGLVGPNGSGKSTMLKIISAITLPTAGRVEVAGRVGTLIEVGAGFHPEMTGRENVYLNGSILGLSRREIARHFDEIVAFAELERFIDLPVKKYSSGMYVRLGFSVATMVPPDVLLVDEILSVGDLAFQRKSIARMRELKRSDTTILFVSHNLDAVRNFCTRGVFLLEGRVVFDGSTDEAISRYYQYADRTPVGWCPSRQEPFAPGTARAEIARAELVDTTGKSLESLVPGDPCRLRFEIRPREPLPAAQVAIAIFDSDGTLLSKFTTRGDGVSLGAIDGPREISVNFPHGMPLARGMCRVSVTVLDGDCMEILSSREDAVQIPMLSRETDSGLAHVQREWKS